MQELDDTNYIVVNQYTGKVCIVDFYADWCGPCKAIAPILKQLDEELDINFFKIDVDASPNAAAEFGVQSMPTLLAFNGKELVGSHVGAASKAALTNWVSQFI